MSRYHGMTVNERLVLSGEISFCRPPPGVATGAPLNVKRAGLRTVVRHDRLRRIARPVRFPVPRAPE
jgi:hypothetical protein